MMKIPMSSPDITDSEISAVSRVLHTPFLSFGPYISDFERKMTQFIGTAHAVGVNSGTSGLHLAIIAAGVTTGDLVITSPFSFIASSNVILYERAIPIFVDADRATGNIDPALVAEAAHDLNRWGSGAQRWLPPSLKALTSSHNLLKSLLPVHAFGQPADMASLLETASLHNLSVIEDACEAIGAAYRGPKVGTFGDAAAFAFYPNKQMTTGEGGMIVTNKDDWDALFRSLRNQGRDVFDAWLNHTRLGYNYRMDELSAALGLAQLERIEELLSKREKVAQRYNERFAGLYLVERPYIAPTTTRMSWFVYVIRINSRIDRNKVIKELETIGIPSRPYFTPIHLQPFYREKFGYKRADFPITEYLGDVSLALPFSGVMTEGQVDYVCEHLIKILNKLYSEARN